MELADTELLAACENYIDGTFQDEDEALRRTREASAAAGLPTISVGPSQGKLLYLLAKLAGARRILELGTLGGYSGTWLARALPEDGKLITLELSPHHAEVARENFERNGLSDRVSVHVGPALASLARFEAAGEPAFDVVFIDADKDGYPEYLAAARRLVRVGGLILVDNALSRPLEPGGPASPTGRCNAAAAAAEELEATIVPYARGGRLDGLLVARRQR